MWRASTGKLIVKLFGFHRRAVRQLAFSPTGNKLLSIGEDDNHSLAIYDWANSAMVANCKTDQDKVFSASWKSESEFATCGVKHMQIYSQTGQNIAAKRCTYLTQIPGTGVMMTCCIYLQNGDLISGVSTG